MQASALSDLKEIRRQVRLHARKTSGPASWKPLPMVSFPAQTRGCLWPLESSRMPTISLPARRKKASPSWRPSALVMAFTMLTLGLLSIVAPRSTWAQPLTSETTDRPNILLILVDDMGFSDPGCFGGEIQTPTLDRLAQQGIRFNQWYNFAKCCPTRAALMTGHYPHDVGVPLNGASLSRDIPTIAELMRDAGYHTAHVGKWHLSQDRVYPGADGFQSPEHLAWINRQTGFNVPFSEDVWSYPINRGFESSYGCVWGVYNFFNPFSLVRGQQAITQLPDDYYITDDFSREAAEVIDRLAPQPEPFFLYLAYNAPHWPLHAPQETIDRYNGVYDQGWDELQRQRFAGAVAKGILPKGTRRPDNSGNLRWEQLDPQAQACAARRMQVHAAMVDRVDQGLARVMERLEASQEMDNTLIIFLSDNGASPEIYLQPGYDRVTELADGTPVDYGQNLPLEQIGTASSNCYLGPGWASAANSPFRYWKMTSYEGGMHTPGIIRWPAGLAPSFPPGSVSPLRINVQDISATLLDIAGVRYPREWKGKSIPELPSRSFLPALQDRDYQPIDTQFFEHAGGAAMIQKDWKIVRKSRRDAWELYQLSVDPTEVEDLAQRYPERTQAMAQQWEGWFQGRKSNQ